MIETFEYIKIRLNAMTKTERGASAVEYGLLVALIAIVIIVAVTLLGGNLSKIFDKTANSIGKNA
jgi:pilus assembly protein Flp/PilA